MGCGDATGLPQNVEEPDPHPSPCHGQFRFEGNFTPEQRADIASAVYRWDAFLGYAYFSVRDEDAKCAFRVGDVVTADEKEQIAPYGGGYFAEKLEITVDFSALVAYRPDQIDRSRGPAFQTVIMHELGHTIGLKHQLGVRAIMAPDGRTVAEDFTDADRAECQRVKFCN